MSRWSVEDIKNAMDEFQGPRESSDAKDRKRERIVRAAKDLFVKNGYRKTSMDEIARVAGVGKGTVYLYFKTKADLLVYTIVEEKKHYLKEMAPIFELPPREQLRAWLRLVFVMPSKMPLMSRLLEGDHEILLVLDEMDPGMREKSMEVSAQFLREIIDQAATPHRWTREELDDRVRVLQGLAYFSGLLKNDNVRGGLSRERYGGILADLLMDGIGPPAAKGE